MDTTTRDDLRVALRFIRDGGRTVRDSGWASAPLLQDAVNAASPILTRPYELPGEVDWLRAQLVVDCGAWLELCISIRGAPTNSNLKEAGRALAGHMVDRADALLAWLQAPKS